MSSSPATSDSDPADYGEIKTITALQDDILLTQILNRLDGTGLASASSASKELNSLCSDDGLWRSICNSTWPSTDDSSVSAFTSGYRSFYSDVFPALSHYQPRSHQQPVLTAPELISAVDIRYDGRLIYSKVLVTETRSTWFLNTPFRLDLLDPGDIIACGGALDSQSGERLEVSWILIDPVSKRAANMASEKAVEVRGPWAGEGARLRFATVLSGGVGESVHCGVVVPLTYGGKGGRELHVREMSLQAEDLDGGIMTGGDCLCILLDAMRGGRRKRDGKTEKDEFESFSLMKEMRRRCKMKREEELDMAVMAVGISAFLTGLMIWLWSKWG